jgi:hypothetical protein
MGRLEECAFDKSDCRKAHCTDQAELENCDEIETGIPLVTKDERWIVHADRTRYLRDQFHSLAVLFLMLACVVLCMIFYMTCTKCLFFILLFCVLLCPFYNSFNLPLWIAIIMLIISGWSFSAGALSITWNNGK